MLIVQNRRFKKQHVIGGSGIFDSLVKALTSQTAKNIGKEVGKTALEVGRSVAVDAGKKLIERAMRPKPSKKLENIVNKYMDGSAVAIQDLMKRLNGSGLKEIC